MTFIRHPQSPLLDHCPEALPPDAYYSADWYQREQRSLWLNNWVCVGRLNDLECGTMRREDIAGASIILCRAANGDLTAYHNTCRHRGSELCLQPSQPLGKLITCPYHAWSYSAADGRLVSVAHATPTDDFKKEEHSLYKVQLQIWRGFIFVKLGNDARPLAPDLGLEALANWPMDELVTGHRWVKDMECNWKGFWDNYNECLHCPGIHPELCDMVPLYRRGIMSAQEAPDWSPDHGETRNLKEGAESWTMTGAPCGPVFEGLTARERENGYNFVTIYPTMYVVGHVDYVRAVRLMPTGPDTARLTAEWYFPQATLNQPGFDAAHVAAFAKIVMGQDGDAAEMNQRGLRSPAFKRGRLMPQEFDIYKFHNWVIDEMKREVAA
ncbi:aromatic ring-hydroxylating oxygenase subunit alpha [Aestuariivirga litoralis]|uniref:aromatic ring-hydroxylating oxygenase subunit alpha n=1 Tax=Aestuariivirga litoralis TaxID=2650924 RepID=UPI0018C83790|nr:aromatic ring-hydroxylating dioxygenase subunit alpha [Aestuariivirga litoralis]MBG1230770.1 aromatic ring-hydroxylating dioxygenase subunit alpha [Aestuariivirga litoralis]